MGVLSLGQERLWFLDQIDPGDVSFNIQLAHRLRGQLQVDALQVALDTVVSRHESLRSRFPSEDGEPVLVVEPPAPVPIERLDVSAAPAAERDALALQLLSSRSSRPFDLAQGPLLRVALVRYADDEHIFAPVLHHSVADGWSANIFMGEIAALLAGEEVAPLPLQYPDFAVRQRGQADQLDGSLDYWRDQLQDLPSLELPTDRPRGAAKTTNGDVVSLLVPAELTDALDALARSRRCTGYMLLLAAYQVLLGRHAGQDDFAIGTPVAGRDSVDLEPLIGYFSNTLVMRADLSGDPTFGELLVRVRKAAVGAYSHAQIPFERLMAELRIERDLSRTALFQTMLAVHTEDAVTAVERRPGGLEMTYFDAGLRHTKFELAVDVWRNADGMEVAISYNTDVYDRSTVQGIADRFGLLLAAIVAAPDARISTIELLTEADRSTLSGWGTGVSQPAIVPLLQGIPVDSAGPAVVCGDEVLTYALLAERSDRLAAALVDAGVNPGDRVGLCLPRSPAAVVTMLAIWKAGAAYLPLDPELPAERLAFVLADSGVGLVVADRELPVRTISPSATGWAALPGAQLDDVAYVIYTSGSTGQPKGVGISHRSLAARVGWMRESYELNPADTVAQFASLSFDTHAEEIYPCLTSGATLALLPDGGTSLPEFLSDGPGSRVTVLDLPTPYWHELVLSLDSVPWPAGLRLVILGADQVRGDAVDQWLARFPDVRLVNTYGPTETTIIATSAELTGGDARPPIGRPLSGTTLQVRDPDGALVPPGSPGELWIGGVGVATGYLNRPELTAERFVDGWYGSGDRVRWRPDGRLEFLGRLDGQVKVRGYRVEPGEIEACLRGAARVEQVVVVAAGESLIAYVVGAALLDAELRAHCAASLPSYMVPNAFVHLERLPLTSNGKLDVRGLPAADQRPQTAHEFVPPRTDAEQLVVDIWAAVLGIDEVGALDDFFELGGHSLLATKVVARVSAAVGLPIAIRTLFLQSTVAGFALAVEDALAAEIDEMTDEEAEALLVREGAFPG